MVLQPCIGSKNWHQCACMGIMWMVCVSWVVGRIHKDWGSIPLPKSIMILLIFLFIVFFLNFFQFILRAFDLVGVYVVKSYLRIIKIVASSIATFTIFLVLPFNWSPRNFSLKMFHQHTLSYDLEDWCPKSYPHLNV